MIGHTHRLASRPSRIVWLALGSLLLGGCSLAAGGGPLSKLKLAKSDSPVSAKAVDEDPFPNAAQSGILTAR